MTVEVAGRIGTLLEIANILDCANMILNHWRQGLAEVPPEIWQHLDAEQLILADNELTRLSEGIGRFSRTRMLDLGHNKLASIPAAIGMLTGLSDFLYLPRHIARLTRLRELYLQGNAPCRVDDAIGALLELRFLDLRGNRVANVAASIGQLPKLRALDLRSNDLTELPDSISTLPVLEKLDLRWNPQLPAYPWFALLEARGCAVYR